MLTALLGCRRLSIQMEQPPRWCALLRVIGQFAAQANYAREGAKTTKLVRCDRDSNDRIHDLL
jgi:hypothetical protein